MSYSWKCPFCQHAATISEHNLSGQDLLVQNNGKDGVLKLTTMVVTCPNKECREYSISASLFKELPNKSSTWEWQQPPLMKWQLRPQSSARPFPGYIPSVILEDYREACLIRDLSPKASATLARRCLQGMIRDYWGETGHRTLFQEISAIKSRVDPEVWNALDAVRKIGNIGAHMEQDINLVIEVDPQEAQMLIQLIEMLLNEWYVARKQRSDQLASIVALAEAKTPS